MRTAGIAPREISVLGLLLVLFLLIPVGSAMARFEVGLDDKNRPDELKGDGKEAAKAAHRVRSLEDLEAQHNEEHCL